MTQEYTPSIETIIDVYASARANAMQIQLSDEWDREHKRIVKQAMGTLAAHDAQIRAEALELTNEELDVAARAAFDSRDDAYDLDEWEDADSDDRERYQCYVRPAFSAVAKHRKEQQQ